MWRRVSINLKLNCLKGGDFVKRLLLIFIISVTLALSGCTSYDRNIEHYGRDAEKYYADGFMPALDSLEGYTDARYLSKKVESLFSVHSMCLTLTYDRENFAAEKARVSGAYAYLDSPVVSEFDADLYTVPAVSFSHAGFDFRVVSAEDMVYPKYFGMIGISDEKCEIAYLWVYDPDLDYVCETDADLEKEMIEQMESWFSFE